jgi:hypothetical protein
VGLRNRRRLMAPRFGNAPSHLSGAMRTSLGWCDDSRESKELLRAGIGEWEAKLLEAPEGSIGGPSIVVNATG